MFVASGASVRLGRHVPQRLMVAGSLGLVGLGTLVLLALGARSSRWAAEPGLLLAGIGAGVFNAVGSELAMSAAPDRHAGLASAVNDTFRQGGIPLGVAVYGALVPASAAIGRGQAHAFMSGFHHAVLLAAAIALSGACAAHRLLENAGHPRPASLASEAA